MRIENDIYLITRIKRKDYIDECNSTSALWIDHAVKLMLFISPNDVKGWLASVRKGFEVETKEVEGLTLKPRIEHLSDITDENSGEVCLSVLDSKIGHIKEDNKSLPCRNLGLKFIAKFLIDLVNRFDGIKLYSEAGITDIVNDWYREFMRSADDRARDRALFIETCKEDYVARCNATSALWIDHAVKLMLFVSPNDVEGWLESVCKGFYVEAKTIIELTLKPRIEHLSDITDNNDEVRLSVLEAKIEYIKYDYESLPCRDLDLEFIAKSLIDLVSRFNRVGEYSISEVSEIVNEWYQGLKLD